MRGSCTPRGTESSVPSGGVAEYPHPGLDGAAGAAALSAARPGLQTGSWVSPALPHSSDPRLFDWAAQISPRKSLPA